MKVEFSENDLARVVKFLRYSEKILHAQSTAYILDLKDGRGLLIFNEAGRSAFCKIFDGWNTEWGSGCYNNLAAELWLTYNGGAVELTEKGYTINGRFYQDKFIQSGGANGFYKLAIDDERERQNGSAFRFPCKIKKSECILFNGGKWYSIGYKKGAFSDVSSSGNLEPGGVNYSVCFAGENLYKYGIKPGFFTQIFQVGQDRSVLRCYYDNTDFKELVITIGAPAAGVKYACRAADSPFIEMGKEQKKEPLPPSKWNEKQEQKSAENYKRTAAKFDVKKQWGDILHPEGIYINGKDVFFQWEDARVHLDKKLNGGAGFFVTGTDGKKYLLELDNDFWDLQADYKDDSYNSDKYVKKKEGAKYDLANFYGGDIKESFVCDLSEIYNPSDISEPLTWEYIDSDFETFQIYGYEIDWGTARIIPTNQTDDGKAVQVESIDGTASFVLEMNIDLDFDFYVNFNLLESLDRDYMYKDDIIRVVDAFPVNWNVTDPARRIMAEPENNSVTINNKEQIEMQEEQTETTETTGAAAAAVNSEPETANNGADGGGGSSESWGFDKDGYFRIQGEKIDLKRVELMTHYIAADDYVLHFHGTEGGVYIVEMLPDFWKRKDNWDDIKLRILDLYQFPNFEKEIKRILETQKYTAESYNTFRSAMDIIKKERESEQTEATEQTETTAPDVTEIVELFKNFDDWNAHHALEELFAKEQEKKGFLYFSEITAICKEINKGAWNTFFYCRPMHYGAVLNKNPEPGTRVIVSDSVFSSEKIFSYDDEVRAKENSICGNPKAQFKVNFRCEILEPLKPSETVKKITDCYNPSRNGLPFVQTPSDAINPEVKSMVKTINDFKRIVGRIYGSVQNYRSMLDYEFHYFRDGEEITDKEPGGASRIDDYTIERIPNRCAVIVNFILTSKKQKPEPQQKRETKNPVQEVETIKGEIKTVSVPAVACIQSEPATIPEPEPEQIDNSTKRNEVDKSKPTWAELRYSLSLLAMPYSINTLIEKFLKKTNKPVRYSVVEKLLMTIDRGSVPNPGESKREYINAYYQNH